MSSGLLSYRTFDNVSFIFSEVGYEYFKKRHLQFIYIFVIPIFIIFLFILPTYIYKKLFVLKK